MDALRKQKFNQAMFSKNRTLAIRVGKYQSSDIKEASFDYGYIKGDTYKPGGTCAGSAKIVFTSVITTFNKLDKIYPEIGLLVDGTYEWVKMGEYFINDIEIDRNRNTTKLDLMDGMFKLNREHVTDLTYPAEIRHVIKEICLKTGITLANEYMDITSMNYRIESIPKEKKMTFRDVLSLATQMLGMSCFFNREGKLEIKGLTDSGITITADSYFMHGLTKSEIEYQIAGITCKKDKETLTVGLRTGRSLEIENVLMYQSALDNLYHSIKDIRYYPYSLNYQGHLLLDVGQWVTIKTNTGETFKSPVLSQSFTFKGGLRGRISADSKAGNDAQYSYAGTITKKIEQFNEIEAQIQSQLEEADKGFDQKVEKIKNDFSDQVELAKAKAEEVKRELSDTINQRFDSFDNGPLQEIKRKAIEALQNAGASSLLAQEAKRIGLDSIARLEEFKRQTTSAQTALSGDLDALKRTIANDIRPKQVQVETEIAKQVEALNQTKKELVGVKSAQATYEETTTQRLAELTNLANGKASKSELTQTAEELASRIASVKVGGRNLLRGSKGPFLPDRKPANFDNAILYVGQTSIYMEQGQEYIISAKTDGTFTAHHDGNKESDNVVLWIMDKDVRNYQIVSDLKTGTTGTKIIWDKPTGIYHLRVNTYHKEATKSVWDVKIEKGNVATDWSPAPEDTDGLITEAKAIFERTAQGLQTGLSAIQEYVNKDGQRQEALQRYTREESAKQATAVRELVTRDYVGKATYQEDVKGINQRIEAVKTSANKDIASQIASYRQSVDGKFTDISSQITTYKQDLGGQISGLSNRITSSEQGTTTQISNLSNRINSNKQGTDNQISNLKTQVATNKDNAERQMGRISDQVSANKANADSQFANVTNQLARKVETTDFQRVKETSQLYERILGNTENGIADKVARMAMTNQLFQVEVSKASAGGRNLFLNSLFKYDLHQRYSTYHVNDSVEQTQGQLALSIDSNTKFRGANTLKIVSTFNGKPNNQKVTFRTGGDMRLNTADEMRNKSVRFSFWAKSTVNNTNFQARAGYRNTIEGVSLTTDWKFYDIQLTKSENSNASNEVIMHVFTAATVWIAFPKVEIGTVSTPFSEAPEDTDEAIRSVQSQLAGSWSVQNINSAGSIVSQINATNNQILIEAEKIRLKGKTLLDELTTIQGYFKRLFVGEGTFATLNADVIRTNSITADKLVMDMAMARRFVSSDLFTDTLAAKEAFINKLRSVVVTATLLEGYQGRIGGFTLGQFDQGGGRWISGVNQFSVGMGNGAGYGVRTAFWANWGNNWNYAGPKAWNVNTDGKMYCRNEVGFYDQVDFSNSSNARFYGSTYFQYSPRFISGIHMYEQEIFGNGGSPRNSGQNAVVWWNQVGEGTVKYWMDQKSDRRLKENITDTAVKALDKINRLRMVAFDFIESKKHEEIGLIAQEVETIVPRIVSRDPENPDGYLHIDYTALVPYLIKAIQELNQKIEKMEKTIA